MHLGQRDDGKRMAVGLEGGPSPMESLESVVRGFEEWKLRRRSRGWWIGKLRVGCAKVPCRASGFGRAYVVWGKDGRSR